MTHLPGKSCRKTGTKGLPDGSSIKSKTVKPWVAKADRKTCYATGQNNMIVGGPLLEFRLKIRTITSKGPATSEEVSQFPSSLKL
jgi:hypothetical protein